MTGSAELKGADTLDRTIKTACDDLDDMTAAHSAAAGIMASAIASRAPRRTGRLAASVSASTDKGAVVNVDAPYAGPIHWGWEARRIPENRWATEAARSTESTWIKEYEDAIVQALAKVRGT
jgi:hypothetical protein